MTYEKAKADAIAVQDACNLSGVAHYWWHTRPIAQRIRKTLVTTNRQWRRFKYRYEVPETVLTDQFDWLDEDDGLDGFIQYRGRWYHTSEFLHTADPNHPMGDWDGWLSDTFFSGVAIKLSDDGEEYQIATAYS